MAVAHDAFSESHTGTTGSTNESSFTWNHTPAGTPGGIQVAVYTIATAPLDTSVTYDGVEMQLKVEAYDTAGEPAFVRLYQLDEPPATSPAAVIVSRTNSATVMYAQAFSETSGSDTYVGPWETINESGAYVEVALDDSSPGVDSGRYATAFYGGNNPPTAGANSTALGDIDLGNFAIRAVRETTFGQGSRNVGFTEVTADDRAAVAWVVREYDADAAGVVHEVHSTSHRQNGTSVSEASFSWTHESRGGSRVKGAFVAVITASSATAQETAVDYGGSAMTFKTGYQATDTATEPGTVKVYELLSSIPSGPQTITVTRNNNATAMWAYAWTVRASGAVQLTGVVKLEENGTLAEQSVSVTSTDPSVAYAVGWRGGSTANIAFGANTMRLQHKDVASASGALAMQLFSTTGSRNVGFSYGTSDDRAVLHFAVELAPDTSDVFTADAVLKATLSSSATADAIVKQTLSSSFTADASLKLVRTDSATADAVLKRTQTGSATADAVIAAAFSGTLTADAVIRATRSSSATADSVLKATTSSTKTADAVLKKNRSGSYTADAVIDTGSDTEGEFTADAVIKAAVSNSFLANAYIVGGTRFTINAVLKATPSASFTASAQIGFTREVIFKALIRKTSSATFSVDAMLNRSFIADAILKRQRNGSFFADAIIGTHTTSFTADAWIYGIQQAILTLDACIVSAPQGVSVKPGRAQKFREGL